MSDRDAIPRWAQAGLTMVDIAKISTSLELRHSGIWFAKHTQDVSYPKHGSAVCFCIEEESFWYEHRNRCISVIARKYLPQGPIFDIGGGNGIVAVMLQQLGFEVCLLEPSFEAIQNAMKRGLTHLVCSTLAASGFTDDSIPAAGIFDVLDHIEDDVAFLTTLRTILVRQGKLLITVPAHRFLWSNNDEHLGHFRRYTLNALCAKLTSVGFSVDYATYFFVLLPVPMFLFRTLPSMWGLCTKQVTPERKRAEHGLTRNWLRPLIDPIQRTELACITRGWRIPVGSSCFVVATKP